MYSFEWMRHVHTHKKSIWTYIGRCIHRIKSLALIYAIYWSISLSYDSNVCLNCFLHFSGFIFLVDKLFVYRLHVIHKLIHSNWTLYTNDVFKGYFIVLFGLMTKSIVLFFPTECLGQQISLLSKVDTIFNILQCYKQIISRTIHFAMRLIFS